MARRGPEDVEGETGPVRTCALTRERLPVERLIRFVIGPEDVVVPDLRHRLPGRGVWIGASAARVAEAVKRKVFPRAFKGPARAGPELPLQIDGLLARDALQSLAMANKAGLVIAGFGKVEQALRFEPVCARISALDGAPDGRAKLERLASARFGSDAPPPLVDLFDSTQLSLALGRENVIHALVLKGAAGDAFVGRCRTLAIYRTADPRGPERGGD